MYGNKLKEIRTALSATQEQMAENMGVAYRTYVSYERNENNPSFSMLTTLCNKYKINLNWFIADNGEMFVPENKSIGDIIKSLLHKEVLQILNNEGFIKQ